MDATSETDQAAPRRAVVIVASTRASDGTYEDRTGPILMDTLAQWGFAATGPIVVPDGPAVGQALREALATRPELIFTTGGTGVSPTDRTPQETAPLLDLRIDGIPELLRATGVAKGLPVAVLSRGIAGVSNGTLVINLPGSRGGVNDALGVLRPIVTHAIDQVRGIDHEGRVPMRGSRGRARRGEIGRSGGPRTPTKSDEPG